MNEADVLTLARETMWVMIKVGAPVMMMGLAVGLVISLFQALTQIQEATLSFVPKMLAVCGMVVLMLPFMLSSLEAFTNGLADRIIGLGAG